MSIDALLVRSRPPPLFSALFAEDFDAEHSPAPPVAAEPDLAPAAAGFDAAELDAARADGVAAGLAEAERALAATRCRVLAEVSAALQAGREEARHVADAAAEAVTRCIMGALAACLPTLCQAHGTAEARAVARAILPALSDEPRVTIRVNPHQLAALQADLAGLDAEVTDRLTLLATDAIAPGDIRINWNHGSAVRDAGRARIAITDALDALGLLEREMADA